jgi:hypothetical protein
MKNVHPLKTAKRTAYRLEKLGSKDPVCLFCGCSEPMLLRPVTRRFLEEHHVVGIANDPELTLALCFNCHALITEGLLQAGVNMTRESDPKKFAANMFQALAVHHDNLSAACKRFATELNTDEDNAMTVVCYDAHVDFIGFILLKALRVWNFYGGEVPATTLRQLELDLDSPRGSAKQIMQMIGKDAALRKKIEQWAQSRSLRTLI